MFGALFAVAVASVLAEPAKTQFAVQTRVVEIANDAAGQTRAQKVAALTIRVPEGISAHVATETQTAFVTAIRSTAQGPQPVITVLSEGFRIELTATSIDLDHVAVDVKLQSSKLGEVKERVVEDHDRKLDLPRLETSELRFLDVVELGDKTVVSFGQGTNRTLEFVIREYRNDE